MGNTIQLSTIEPTWEANIRNVSCIPSGTYNVVRDLTGHHKYFLLEDVKSRFNIEMHTGNYAHQTKGCILVGQGLFPTGSSPSFKLKSSRKAMDFMLERFSTRFELKIG